MSATIESAQNSKIAKRQIADWSERTTHAIGAKKKVVIDPSMPRTIANTFNMASYICARFVAMLYVNQPSFVMKV